MSIKGTHSEGNITFTAATAIKERYLFGALTNGATIKVSPAGAGNKTRAIGVITDSASAGDPVNMQVMGSNAGTMKVLAGSSITAGDLITADSNSRACSYEASKTGSFFIYGIALSDASAGECVEFTPVSSIQPMNTTCSSTPAAGDKQKV